MKKPVRVLQVVSTLNRGGIETLLLNLFQNIDRSKVQFDFLKLKTGNHDYDDEIVSLGGNIFQVSDYHPKNIFLGLDSFFKEKSNNYDIVHSHIDSLSSIPLFYAKKYKIGIRIAHGHSYTTFESTRWKYPIKKIFEFLIPFTANHYIACNKEVGKRIFKRFNFEVLNNGIDTKLFRFDKVKRDSVRKSLGISNELVVGHVGGFRKVKNHIFLIDVFEALTQIKEDVFLVLIGDGTLKNELEECILEKGMTNKTIFLGSISNVYDYLNVFDLFVLPSIVEGTPLVLVEAQTSGLPCLVSEKVSREVGITPLVKYASLNENPLVWAENILELSKMVNERDTAYLRIIEKGFDVHDNVRFLEGYYESLLR